MAHEWERCDYFGDAAWKCRNCGLHWLSRSQADPRPPDEDDFDRELRAFPYAVLDCELRTLSEVHGP